MELPDELDLIEPFAAEDEDAAHNLAELLHRKGFDAWVLPDEDDRLGVFVESSEAIRAKEQAGYIRAEFGADLSGALLIGEEPGFADRAVGYVFAFGIPCILFFMGIKGLLTPPYMRDFDQHPAVSVAALVVGAGWLGGVLYLRRRG